jgi:23S rRNA (guanosine2251-2'-O)-methyltransferase
MKKNVWQSHAKSAPTATHRREHNPSQRTKPARERSSPYADPTQHSDLQGEVDWVFGLHAVTALLKHNASSIQSLLVLQGRQDERVEPLLERARRLGLPYQEVSRSELDEKFVGAVHQGIAAHCQNLKLERSEGYLLELLKNLDHPPLLLALDGVTDPHNLGACLRSAEAAGVDAVIVPKDKSALINATVRKVACGAAEIMPFIAVTNLSRTLKELQEQRLWIMGAAGEAEQSLYQTDLRGPAVIVLGSEGSGMRRLTREHCDVLFSIPMAGEVSSLNVSVSAGVCLFEAVRQRRLNKA